MEVKRYDIRNYRDKFTEVLGAVSESNPSKVYTVALNKDGSWMCGCPRWTRNKTRPECKHIRYIKDIRKNGFASQIGLMNAPMPDDVKQKLSTFAAIEV